MQETENKNQSYFSNVWYMFDDLLVVFQSITEKGRVIHTGNFKHNGQEFDVLLSERIHKALKQAEPEIKNHADVYQFFNRIGFVRYLKPADKFEHACFIIYKSAEENHSHAASFEELLQERKIFSSLFEGEYECLRDATYVVLSLDPELREGVLSDARSLAEAFRTLRDYYPEAFNFDTEIVNLKKRRTMEPLPEQAFLREMEERYREHSTPTIGDVLARQFMLPEPSP